MSSEILRYSAFATDPTGGNPAGIVLDAHGLDDADMQEVAAAVGYSETAFLSRRPDGEFDVRYFSPRAEVSFCGHATIAAAVAHAERHGPGTLALHTRSGLVRVDVDDQLRGTLVSVAPRVVPLDPVDLEQILAALGWTRDDLDPSLVPAIGYAGAWHPVIPVDTRARLAELDYDFERLGALMALHDWTTIALIWRENSETIHARNPFPPGGVVEDPATGAAAAALGAYLADRNALPESRTFVVHQGDELGRHSRLTVAVPRDHGEGIRVSGAAVAIEDGPTRSWGETSPASPTRCTFCPTPGDHHRDAGGRHQQRLLTPRAAIRSPWATMGGVETTCPGCGLPGQLSASTHAYIGASPYCWSRYGELLAGPGEKQDYVDAYAAQHPGVPGRRQVQSVVSHLVSLCAALEQRATPEWRVRLLRAATVRSGEFAWLEPPRHLGAVTVADVLAGTATGDDWIRAVWSAWADHHGYVRRWAVELASKA